MMNYVRTALHWLRQNYRRPKVIALFGLGLIIVGGIISAQSGGEVMYDEIRVSKTSIDESISVTAKVEAARDISLAFERGGKVASVNVRSGSRVGSGMLLATLENTGALADVRQAEANLSIEEIKLTELENGTRPEELKIFEIKRDNAIVAQTEAKREALDAARTSYTKVEDAIRNKIDQFYTNPRASSPRIIFTIGDSQLVSALETQRVATEAALLEWAKLLVSITPESDAGVVVMKSEQYADTANTLLKNMALAVNSLSTYGAVSQATIDAWKASVATARSNADVGVSALISSDNAYQKSSSSLALAEQEYALALAGSTSDQIAVQQARVLSAKAGLLSKQAEYEKTVIRAPISGIITKREIEPGEIVSANTLAIGLIGESEEELEAAIPEVDVAKISIGDPARVEFDAFPGEEFVARVVAIDPSATIVSGVATYTTRLQFDKPDERIRSGMTTSVVIITDHRDEAIVIPIRALQYRNSGTIVLVRTPEGPQERSVVTGIKDNMGNVEILSGLSSADTVLQERK